MHQAVFMIIIFATAPLLHLGIMLQLQARSSCPQLSSDADMDKRASQYCPKILENLARARATVQDSEKSVWHTLRRARIALLLQDLAALTGLKG